MEENGVSYDYNKRHGGAAGLTPSDFGAATWSDHAHIEAWQRAHGLRDDGAVGPATVAGALAERKRVQGAATEPDAPAVGGGLGVVLGGVRIPSPVPVVTWLECPELLSVHTSQRTRPVTQLVLHRGAETRSLDPMATKAILDGRKLSSLFTLTPDGVIHQHFDPAKLRGRHCEHHNVSSDSIDVQGPLGQRTAPYDGQTLFAFSCAIGLAKSKEGTHRDAAALAPTPAAARAAVLARKMVRVRQWSLSPAQAETLRLFVPWWCALRGIPARACDELRTFRVGGLGLADPATDVTGVLAHAQVAGPGDRIDGLIELRTLQEAGVLDWRAAEDFWS